MAGLGLAVQTPGLANHVAFAMKTGDVKVMVAPGLSNHDATTNGDTGLE